MNKKRCILLVDDDDISNFLAKKVITKLQISDNIYSAKNGREALNFIDEHCEDDESCTQDKSLCPDLVFLDINMPIMNGLDFLEEFYRSTRADKACFKEVNIYVLTSSEDQRDQEIVKGYNNVKGYISKPLTLETLQALA